MNTHLKWFLPLGILGLLLFNTVHKNEAFTITTRFSIVESFSDDELYIAQIHEVIVTKLLDQFIEDAKKHVGAVTVHEDSFCNQIIVELTGTGTAKKKAIENYLSNYIQALENAAKDLDVMIKTTSNDTYTVQILHIKDIQTCNTWTKRLRDYRRYF